MLVTDFKDNNIDNFTPKEVEETGADLKDVKKESIISLQSFRTYIRRRVGLIHNGITTGYHKSLGHPNGFSVDSFLYIEDGPVNIHQIFKGALHAGFVGIGIYYNQKMYSLHLEVASMYRKEFAFWVGVKDTSKQIDDWQWFSLLNDPAKILLKQ